ncbi:MAG: hypothetical protein COT15_01800 [Candidatus Diapherotrites archaeon CG08_land_8_20_14_0_20_34_12]|nr:MAG: hypothetical protein COT15_01800 [Candidatus Diapherotrites archaeon CG08_land_8_20_14_0_20_34_12]
MVLPNHILIIPDGNRRYAKGKNLDLKVVYKHIADHVTTELIDYLLLKRKIKELSFFAIARNNVLQREGLGLKEICDAQVAAYDSWLKNKEFLKNIKFKFIGDLDLLPSFYVKKAKELENATKGNTAAICNLLTAYDTKWELYKAIEKIRDKKVKLANDAIYEYLEIQNHIDMVVRTGYEKRFSTCPLIQIEYAELFFTDYYYPELTIEKLNKLLNEYGERERRFGK